MALTRATDKIVGNSDGNLNLSGIVTASSFSGSGANLSGINTAFGNSSVNTSGIITATSFFGDGSNLTNLPAGLGTALSSTQTSPLNKLYFTNEVLSIGATVTVDHPATSTGAYTQYADIRLEEGADLIIEDGDDVIPDILGLGTDGGGLGAGGSGRIRVDSITNKNANGAPNFPNGLTGTAGTFTGNLTVSGNLGVGGTLTYEDVTNIDSVGVITARSGINVSGGNLLVGTTSGSGKLHVEDSGQILAYIVGNTSSAGSRLVLQNKNTTANCFTGVEGADAGGQTTASILFYNANNSTNEGFLTLQTRPANGLPTERLRIDSSGRLLIGTTTEGHASADDFTVASSANTGITIRSGTSSEGNIYFSKGTSGSDEYKGIVMYNHNGNAMQFYTDTAERLRINSSGKLLVGRTSSITITGDGSSHVFEQLDDNGYAVGLHCDQSNQRGLGIYYNTSRTPADAIRFVVGGSAKFIVLGSGNVTNANNSYGNISDVSLKENIVDAGSQWNDIKNIKIRNYNFKESTGQETHKQIGVVAQELETVCPKLVSTDQDGMKNVASSVLYMKAVKALQEAQTRIETLEAEVAALKGS